MIGDARAAALMAAWELSPDGVAFSTGMSRLYPVRHEGRPAMLKLGHPEEMTAGGDALDWWGGHGAVRLIARTPDALLMQRAGPEDLIDVSAGGRDDAAVAALCEVAARLHAPRSAPVPPRLVPLAARHAELAASGHPAASVLAQLLATAPPPIPLHGDLHHGNIVADGAGGWLAIDPKGLLGERAADFGQFFLNPDLADPDLAVGRLAAVVARRLDRVAVQAALDRERLRRWVHVNAAAVAAELAGDGSPDAAIAAAVAAATA